MDPNLHPRRNPSSLRPNNMVESNVNMLDVKGTGKGKGGPSGGCSGSSGKGGRRGGKSGKGKGGAGKGKEGEPAPTPKAKTALQEAKSAPGTSM